MKTPRSLPILLVSLVLSGCAIFQPQSGPKALIGTWTNSLGTVWMIHGDGTFDVDLNKDGKRDAWGKYHVDGDTMTIVTTGGVAPKGCKGDGVYHFHRAGDALHFTLVKDACKLRIKNVLMEWHRK